MPLPSFSVTGNLNDIPGANVAGELVTTALSAATLRFTDNTRAPHIVLWDGELYRLPRTVTVYVSDDGSISDEDNPVVLLANDPGLNVTGLQWTVEIVIGSAAISSWTFDAPDDGGTVELATVAHAPGVTATGAAGVTEAQLLALIGDGASDVHDAIVALGAGFFNLPATTHAATGKTTPVDADELALVDSAASNGLKKLTWANLKATIKAYYDTVTASPTNKNLTSGTNTFPTFNQNTTGSAATLTTPRNIDGQSFNGSANITVIAPGTHAATGKTTPVDADELALVDSAASNVLKKLTWLNLKKQAVPVFNAKNYGTTHTTIQAAIGEMPSAGGTLHFPDGTYTIGASVTITKPMRITCDPGAVLKMTVEAPAFAISDTSDVSIDGLTFDGDRDTLSDGVYDLIELEDVARVRVHGCKFLDSQSGGIKVTRGSSIWITENYFADLYNAGVGLRDPGTGNYNENIWITDNYFYKTQQGGFDGNAAIESNHTAELSYRYIHVHNNIVHLPEVVGIGLDSLSTSTIRGNIVIKDGTCSPGEAIGFTGSDNVVSDNYAHNDSTSSGGSILFWATADLLCDHNQIVNNRCTNGGVGIAIVFSQNGTDINHLSIQGNHCYGNDRGIQSWLQPGVTTGTQTGIVVANNNLTGNTTEPLSLVQISGSITGNNPVVRDNQGSWSAPRVGVVSPSATPAINTDLYDQVNIYSLATAVTSMTTNLTGTPGNGQELTIIFNDTGSARAIAWGAKFVGNLLTTTNGSGLLHIQQLKYDALVGKWAGTYKDATGY